MFKIVKSNISCKIYKQLLHVKSINRKNNESIETFMYTKDEISKKFYRFSKKNKYKMSIDILYLYFAFI